MPEQAPLKTHHMTYHWHRMVESKSDTPIRKAELHDKALLIGRVGLMMLSVGTGAYRVRESMDILSRELGVTCSADIGLVSLECTIYQGEHAVTQALSLKSTGINTDKLMELQKFVRAFPEMADTMTADELHRKLDVIRDRPGHYSPARLGCAAGLACFGFTFLLGGGLVEMICTLLGAGAGNAIKSYMVKRKLTLLAGTIVGVAAACLVYVLSVQFGERFLGVSPEHEAGYICAMLFIIPGFPLITGGIDLAKLDMRSGLERMSYAVLIILVATATGWVTAAALSFRPADFIPQDLWYPQQVLLRLLMSFFGVYGFSLMYNSPRKMAATAGLIGAVSNTVRLSLVSYLGMAGGEAAFIGALLSGLLASAVRKKSGYPRISLTVPSIVIMVPGMYMYRSLYNLGVSNVAEAAHWMSGAFIIVLALPLGLVAARILTDRSFRHVI